MPSQWEWTTKDGLPLDHPVAKMRREPGASAARASARATRSSGARLPSPDVLGLASRGRVTGSTSGYFANGASAPTKPKKAAASTPKRTAAPASKKRGRPAADEAATSDDEEPPSSRKRKRAPAKKAAKASSRRTSKKSAAASESDFEDEGEQTDEDQTEDQQTDEELWRPGVKSRLPPGKEVIIKLPKARPAGKTPYADDTIHPNTMLFLSDLKANNDREWLKAHDADFRQAQADFTAFVDQVTAKLVDRDPYIPELPAKDVVFRIYRDIRFSNDPTPYKTHFSAAWSRTGRKGPYAAYYLQIAPGKCFLGGGLWGPEKDALAAMRAAADGHPDRLKQALSGKPIRDAFLGKAKDDKGAVKAFCAHNAESALKRHPKGYEESNPNIAVLRLKNYTLGHKMKDSEVVGPGGLDHILNLLGTLEPFVTYLNSVVMPDEEPSDDDSE